MKKCLYITAVLLIMLFVLFAGCGAPADGIVGCWYNAAFSSLPNDRWIFNSDGTARNTIYYSEMSSTSFDFTYTFDAEKGEGTLFMYKKEYSTFTLSDGELKVQNMVYSRKPVGQ
jgi:hypothetical protein